MLHRARFLPFLPGILPEPKVGLRRAGMVREPGLPQARRRGEVAEAVVHRPRKIDRLGGIGMALAERRGERERLLAEALECRGERRPRGDLTGPGSG